MLCSDNVFVAVQNDKMLIFLWGQELNKEAANEWGYRRTSKIDN
jgi:hypothetical protein